jgi:formiminoglutamase
MSLNDYFTPVSLEKPDEQILLNPDLFCRHITIHTPDNPINNINDYKIAILGVPECRASQIPGIELTPDLVRNILYQLRYIEKKPKIIDLGNLKLGKEPSDTYFGLRDVILELLSFNILPVIIGGSQDLTYGLFLAFEYLKQQYTLTTIDCKLDIAFETYEKITFKNYLNSIILENKFLFEYLNLGQQACYSLSENNELFESLFYENIRLGLLRNQIASTEPYLRDSAILSVDFSSIKHADAPGQAFASPNGFNAEDICQMARFAGFGENLKTFGLFDINPENDHNQVTINLAAQVIWYLLDGYAIRVNESPTKNPEEFKKFIVTYDDTNKLIFYKSLITQRWWCEVPSKKAQSLIIACSEDDYINASKSEIPDRWLKILKKLN